MLLLNKTDPIGPKPTNPRPSPNVADQFHLYPNIAKWTIPTIDPLPPKRRCKLF